MSDVITREEFIVVNPTANSQTNYCCGLSCCRRSPICCEDDCYCRDCNCNCVDATCNQKCQDCRCNCQPDDLCDWSCCDCCMDCYWDCNDKRKSSKKHDNCGNNDNLGQDETQGDSNSCCDCGDGACSDDCDCQCCGDLCGQLTKCLASLCGSDD